MKIEDLAGDRPPAEERTTSDEAADPDVGIPAKLLILDNIAYPIIVCRMSGRIVYVNEAACRLTRLPRERLLSMEIFDFHAGDFRERFEQRARGIVAGEKQVFEVAHERPDGTTAFLEITVRPMVDQHESLLVSTIRDSTNRKLATREAEFKSLLLDTAVDSIFTFDADGRVEYANEAAYKTRGYTKEEIYRLSLKDLVAPELRDHIEDHNRDLFQSRSGHFESAHIRKDGSVMPVDVNAMALEKDGRKVLASVVRDATERKRAHAALEAAKIVLERKVEERTAELLEANALLQAEIEVRKKAEQALRKAIAREEDQRVKVNAIVESISDPISLQDTDFRILYQNKVHKGMMGDHAGEFCYRAYQDRDSVCEECMLDLVFKDGQPHVVQKNWVRDPAQFIEISASPIKNSSGTVVAGIELVRDITELKKEEDSLKKAYEEEHRIAEILQERLLRPVPELPGLEVGVAYSPAQAKYKVGGDFYDVFAIDDSNVLVIVGDVAGKGIEAAGLTHTIKSTVRAFAHLDPSPGTIFDHANKVLIGQMAPSKFATAALLLINPHLGLVRYANAGHPPPVLFSADDCRLAKAPKGLPLGSFTYGYEETLFSLKDGESVILYTDGLIEMRQGRVLFGEEGVLGSLMRAPEMTANEIADYLLQDAKRFADGKLNDDVAVVVIKPSVVPVAAGEISDVTKYRMETGSVRELLVSETVPEESTLLDKATLAKLSELFDAMPSYVLLVDEEHHILLANKAVTAQLSVKQDTILGQYCPKVIHGIDGPFAGCPLEEAVDKGRGIEREFHDKESDRWVVSSVYPTRFETSDGKHVFLHMTRDVTERKAFEQALAERDKAIRQAYVDVLSAVTGGKLILMTEDEMDAALGELLLDSMPIDSYKNLSQARRSIKDAMKLAHPDLGDVKEFMVAVGEALTNAVKHAGTGWYAVYRHENKLQVKISDLGQGIDFATLPRATLTAGFSTAQTLGMGFSIMLELSDRLILTTHPGHTSVVLELIVPKY
ncbi:MAG: SpoIIE family protein phosphatase [Candidatus Aquicultorales bacterium]